MASFLYLVMLLVGLLASGSLAQTPPDGYTIEPITWTGILDEVQGSVTLTGSSIQDIEAQAKALDPNFTIFNASIPVEIGKLAAAVQTETGTADNYSVICDKPMKGAFFDRLIEGVEYLMRIKGSVTLAAGPRVCGRISCSYNSAIFNCNDNTHPKVVTWARQAVGASRILDKCAPLVDGVPPVLVSGQYFDNLENWNVMAGHDWC